MKNIKALNFVHGIVISLSVNLLIATCALAEVVLPKASPLAKVTQRIGVTDLTVEYSSPEVNGRKVFGDVVKFGEIWRTGANMCTSLTLTTAANIAGKNVPAGKFCLFTIPSKDSWTIILNGEGNQPGAFAYDETKDVMRSELKITKGPQTERMTFFFSDFDNKKGKLNLSWDNVLLSIPFEINTLDFVNKNIEALSDLSSAYDYVDAAKYVFSELGETDRALKLVNASLEKEVTWNNKWVKAQILAKKGLLADAVKLANQALALGDKSEFFNASKPMIEKALFEWK